MEELYKMFEFVKEETKEKVEYFTYDEEVIVIKRVNNEITEYDRIWFYQSLYDVVDHFGQFLQEDYSITYFDKTTFEEMTEEIEDYSKEQFLTYVKVRNYFYTDKDILNIIEENKKLKEEIKELKGE